MLLNQTKRFSRSRQRNFLTEIVMRLIDFLHAVCNQQFVTFPRIGEISMFLKIQDFAHNMFAMSCLFSLVT